ncbi:Arrestin domain-containing protein 4 [Eumeta japonica]|uniref:Arrestin domain-containing protein 4 n=1 Tax=Eumeta variegata TaxID=151549 RepID=A0A4C1ZTV6_EUMVA|nr:Arrestin domain-containing protein 4 [Eumeta japonica]
MQFEKTFCCLCCASAPLSVDVRAPVSGYCAGQTIPIEIDVDNKSNVQLHLVKVYLRKVVTFRATMPQSSTKKTKHVIVETKEGPAPANTTKHWSLKLEIPSLPPSNLVNCSIIDLDYDLKVECVVSGVHLNLSDKKYITIGTVPLVEGAVPPAAVNGQPVVAPYGDPGQPVAQPTSPVQPPQPILPVQPPQPFLPSPTPSAPNYPMPPAGGEAPGGWVMPAPVPSPYPHPAGSGPAPAQPFPQSLYPTLG